MKVLIIEDDPVQALNLKIQLRELGLTDVSIAGNLGGLKLAISENSFDLVFCDIHLPDVDGITLLAEYLNTDVARAVIIVSVVEDAVLRLAQGMCNQLGYDYVNTLSKPYAVEELRQVLQPLETLLSVQAKKHEKIVVDLSEAQVRTLISEQYVFSVYQPQFSFRTGQLIGVEALARIEHADLGVLSPASFLPQVSALGLMRELYVVMLKKSTAALAVLEHPLRLSLNIAQVLLEEDLFEITTQICNENNYPLSLLTLELTEEQACNPSHRALANIARLKVRGVSFSIDDFGTGYASLEQLIDLPFSEIKIDRKFIARVKDDYKHQQLTMSVLRLAQSLGLHCVAEGVEDLVTWEYLKGLGVDTCQGYYTGRPMAISELLPLYQVALSHNDDDNKDAQKVVLIYDNDTTRGKATVRLLEQELTQYSFCFASRLDEVRNVIRDLPVSLVVFEQDCLSSLSEEQHIAFSNIKQRVECLYLVSMLELDSLSDFPNYITKSETIAQTVRDIVQYIGQSQSRHPISLEEKLSERESHVAKLLLAGFTNKYIAYELGISQKTVSTFKRRVFTKLGVKSIIELSNTLKGTVLQANLD
ncbi:EAL domain-containing protein [Vibrio ponticus]|uniref:EAL domain-containing protein n=1 Tax=Vibrio ponticus TaxID=265668 RepID=A0A3N3DWV0_9VIBR|nr:EAL domain-containing protein [Vibrio ponticus]ROV58957.1 EAL domain-containing protein [Vibrio ponticus]